MSNTDAKIRRFVDGPLHAAPADARWLATHADEFVLASETTLTAGRHAYVATAADGHLDVIEPGSRSLQLAAGTPLLAMSDSVLAEARRRIPALLAA